MNAWNFGAWKLPLAIGVCIAVANVAGAAQTNLSVGSTRATYIVSLSDPPLVADALRRAQAAGVDKASEHLRVRTEIRSPQSSQYLLQLDRRRADVLATASASLGRPLSPKHEYRYAVNGMALELSESEAANLANIPGVVEVRRERIEHLNTDAGPQWIGANALWSGDVVGVGATRGEGVVVGVIDTGINPSHPSFATTGGDGYTHTNPRGHSYGLCATGQATCTSKLIGIYDMTDEGTKGVDSVGHGSHVSGIIAGNAISSGIPGFTVTLQRNVSGVAPHANLIMYKACKAPTTANPEGGCEESDLVAAIDQATTDGVDVINYSIGGGNVDAFELLRTPSSDAFAFFQARTQGVVVVAAAGNEGPNPNTLDEPGNVPWIIGVANASHNRIFANSIGQFTGAANAPASIAGEGYTSGYGPANIVYAGDFGNALCGTGDAENLEPTGASNPFAAGTFHGEIVICDRGIYARVEKGYNVKAAGAGGYILANTQSDGEAVISDNHYLPAVHIGFNEGQQLKGWVATSGTHNGTISGVSAVLNNSFGDILESSSSRGPYGFSGGILKPDVTAPGTNILSSAQTGSGLALMTGTSMASPHVAGSAALILALHPDWSPSQVESALLTTALSGSVRKQDAVTLGSPLDAGAGRVQPAAAALAGLYFPMSSADIRAADPTHGGDPRNLNRSGVEDEYCFGQCNFTRTVTDMSGGGTWQVSVTATSGATITVTPNQFTLSSGGSQQLNIAADVSNPHLPGTWVSGRIVLHKTSGKSAADTAMTAALFSSPGIAPPFTEIAAPTASGNKILSISGLTALPHATFGTTTLVAATTTPMSLQVDPNPDKLYDTFPATGKQFVLLPLTATSLIGRVLIAEVAGVDGGVQVNMYVGVDSNFDGLPSQSEQLCEDSTLSGAQSTARCVVDLSNVPPGTTNAWVLIDIPVGVSATTFNIKLQTGIPMVKAPAPTYVSDNSGGVLTATGPGRVATNAIFPLRLSWGNSNATNALTPGRYYGAVLIDGEPGFDGQSAFVPFALSRTAGNDDVTDPLEPDATRQRTLEPGESLQHTFIDLAANDNFVDVTTTDSGSSVDFYIVRTDFPAPSNSSQVAAAPSISGALQHWTMGGSSDAVKNRIEANPGRYYIVAINNGAARASLGLKVGVVYGSIGYSVTRALGTGLYYNSQRSGHGLFLSQASGQQILNWYTYLEDGTPTWYGAQADATVPNVYLQTWTAPLYRAAWDGAAHTIKQVGDVILTPITDNETVFSWHLDGQAGTEIFSQLGAGPCVTVSNAPTNLNGAWYAPSQSGYGMDVLALPDQEFDAFYFYDALGIPRWGLGQGAPFASSITMNATQSSGFCPTCAFTAITTQPLGTLTVNFANGTTGNYATDFTLKAPMSGTWNINLPINRLTGSSACTQ
jgi:subtilisin family serine protease